MFGGDLEYPKLIKSTKKCQKRDILLPTITPGTYGHNARSPNTDFHIRLLHYKQRQREFSEKMQEADSQRLRNIRTVEKYDRHADKVILQRQIEDRYTQKVAAYEHTIEERRRKLRNLLCEEEKEWMSETILSCQLCSDLELAEMRERVNTLAAERERERLEMVEEKRNQQLMKNTLEFRPFLRDKFVKETKQAQLTQIQEKALKRESEKELEHMWYELAAKESETKIEREKQDEIRREKLRNAMLDTWDLQVRGKQLLKQKEASVNIEEKNEMISLQNELKQEKAKELAEKHKKREAIAQDLKEQMVLRDEFLAKRRSQEKELDDAYTRLADEEINRERQKVQDTTAVAKKEAAVYRDYLKQLEDERKREEQQLNGLLEMHRKEIEEQRREAICKIKAARDKLNRDVLAERASQLEYKRLEMEQLARSKEAENQLLEMACKTNERLQAEHNRLQAENIRRYRDELSAQIAVNNEKRRVEAEQLDRELAEKRAEEAAHKQKIESIMKVGSLEQGTHPFKHAIERHKCKC